MTEITNEQFDAKLHEILAKIKAEEILAMPGVMEIVVEELNNEVISAIESEREESEEN